MFNRTKRITIIFVVLSYSLCGCMREPIILPDTATPQPSPLPPTTTLTLVTPSQTSTFTPTTISPTIQPTITPTIQADGCRPPSENYERLSINGRMLNQRTYEMLEYAASLYGGVIEITGSAITQGSYTSAVDASFGTHAGGGAVDLSVMAPGTYTILEDDIETLIRALRLAGFAAWYRDFDQLYDGSPVHVHAIAIGDRELSSAAIEQLIGLHGYFWGFDGLPTVGRDPTRDPHGGPILCEWMIEMGYPSKTATPSP